MLERMGAGPAVICVLLVVGGLALILDVAGLRAWLVGKRLEQYRESRLARAIGEPTEEAERTFQNRALVVGGFVAIAFAVVILRSAVG